MDSCTEMNTHGTPQHYFSINYDVKARFVSYWHQINEVTLLNPKEVLEIGIGNKFFTNYLMDRGYKITTLDIDHLLEPDIVGNILTLPFFNNSFQIVSSFEVLEHLPYSNFQVALRELNRVSSSHIILSLPDTTPIYRFYLELPRIRPIKMMIKHPFPRPIIHHYDGQHYWEIGKKNFPLKRITYDIKQAGLRIIKSYRIFEIPYHRLFVLSCL